MWLDIALLAIGAVAGFYLGNIDIELQVEQANQRVYVAEERLNVSKPCGTQDGRVANSVNFEMRGEREFVAFFVNLPRNLQARVRQTIADLANDLRNVIISGPLTTLLTPRTNNLRDSIHVLAIEETASSVRGGAGTNLIYAAIQNFGGTINAKNVANLTIPLDAVLTAVGVARYTAHEVISDPSIGGFTGTFFRNGILFGVNGGKNPAEITPLFVLRPSVTLPPHPYMEAGLDQLRAQAESQLRSAITEAAV